MQEISQMFLYTCFTRSIYLVQITRHVLGEVIEKELTTNGKLKNVTKENRKDYCDCYMNYFLKTSIQEQFKAFKEGFMRVCEGKVLVRIYTYD